MLFDAHAHINEESFTEAEREALVKKIAASEVAYVMDSGFDLSSSIQAVKDAQANSWCYAAVGCHPHDAKNMNEEVMETLRELAGQEKVQAIGEIGLDYHYDRSEAELQKEWFRRQIRMANELKMPIVIHTRDAEQDTLQILKEEGAFSEERKSWFPKRKGPDGTEVPDSRVLLHCFSGSCETARQYVKLGATLSICGPVTFKNNRKTREVVTEIPIEYLLVETDSPYLTPEPFRGKQNNSTYVEYTARKVAELKQMTYEEVCEITCRNSRQFFNLTE